jgi:hypothetical protein
MNHTELEKGICMAGSGRELGKAIDSMLNPERNFTYVEIGIGPGHTLFNVGLYLSKKTLRWKAFGIDIEDGWSLDLSYMTKVIQEDIEKHFAIDLTGSQSFLPTLDDDSVDLMLIDGCHGKTCVMQDFLLAEDKIKNGGCIAFHDSDPECQGKDFQPHCGQPIQVRDALKELGLLDGRCKGWVMVCDVIGDKEQEGRGITIFRRI